MVDFIDDTKNCPKSSKNCPDNPENSPENFENVPEMSQEHCPKSDLGENIVKPDGYSMKKKLTFALIFGTVILCSIIGLSVGLGIDDGIKGKN